MAITIGGTCNECRYWEPRGDGWGACESPRLADDSHGIDCLPGGISEPATGPDFGCIHWKAKTLDA